MAALVASVVPHSAALADSAAERKVCAGPSGEAAIAACTRRAEDASETAANRAVAFNNRGLSHVAKGDRDRAIADYNRAIQLKPDFALAIKQRDLVRRLKQGRLPTRN